MAIIHSNEIVSLHLKQLLLQVNVEKSMLIEHEQLFSRYMFRVCYREKRVNHAINNNQTKIKAMKKTALRLNI